MCGSAPIEVLAAPSLTKVVDVLPEKASTISGLRATLLAATAFATGTHNSPSVSSVGSMIPEEHLTYSTVHADAEMDLRQLRALKSTVE